MDIDDPHLNTGEYSPRNYWNARALTSDGNIHQAVCAFRLSDDLNLAAERVQRHFLKKMLSKVDVAERDVLEIGCGVARWFDLIESFGGHYTGVDISDEMIQLASTRRPDGRFMQIIGTELPFSDNSFDLVFSVTVLHHNSFDQQNRILAEAMRVLKDGGHLLLMEDIVHDQSHRLSFNMFLRTLEDWVKAVTTDGRMRVVSAKLARWWFLADRAEHAMRRIQRVVGHGGNAAIPTSSGEPPARFGTWVIRAANAFDIMVQRLLPRRLAVNAVILFEKQSSHDSSNDG